MQIDLNSDMGESFGPWKMGQDAELMPIVTSANIACGFHAGDPLVMAQTAALAHKHGVAIGAHPGYPDLGGFGRRTMDMTPLELETAVLYQIGALAAFARAVGVSLRHVKPHGALYNRAAVDPAVATPIIRAIRRFAPEVILVGLAGSSMLQAARAGGVLVAAEAFVDRAYEANGTLRSRRLPGAMLSDPTAAAAQALSIAQKGQVRAYDGTMVTLHADTLCVHSDTPGAATIASAVRRALESAGISVQALAPPG